jgi:hypothetical protein
MEEQENNSQQQQFFMQSNNMIAKFCTATSIEVVNEHNVILTLLHTNFVIDRVAIDVTHLQNLADLMNQALQDIETKKTEAVNE